MLGASELPLRQGFACGKTLVRRKSAAGPEGPLGGFPVSSPKAKKIDFNRSFQRSTAILIQWVSRLRCFSFHSNRDRRLTFKFQTGHETTV